MTKPNTSKPLTPTNISSAFWMSFGVTVFAAIANVIFTLGTLTEKSVFIIYSTSRQGVNSHLLDTKDLATFTTLFVVSLVLVTGIIALLLQFKRYKLARFIVVIQTGFTGVLMANFFGSVVYYYLENSFAAIATGVVTTIASAALITYFAMHTKPVKK